MGRNTVISNVPVHVPRESATTKVPTPFPRGNIALNVPTQASRTATNASALGSRNTMISNVPVHAPRRLTTIEEVPQSFQDLKSKFAPKTTEQELLTQSIPIEGQSNGPNVPPKPTTGSRSSIIRTVTVDKKVLSARTTRSVGSRTLPPTPTQ